GGDVLLAAMYRDLNLVLSRGPDGAIEAVAAHVAAAGLELPGVIGPAKEAERFAVLWAEQQDRETVLAVEPGLYQLTEVLPARPVSGRMRPLAPADLDVALQWIHALEVEALGFQSGSSPELRERTASRVAAGNLFGWDLEGRLVSMAGLARPTRR